MGNSIKGKDFDFLTICQLHREIYKALLDEEYEESDEIIKNLKQAFTFGKKMNAKLRQYKKNYDDGWYEEHKLEGGEIDE